MDSQAPAPEQLQAALAQERAPLSAADKAQLIQDVSDDILGYGPIDRLLKDDEVSESPRKEWRCSQYNLFIA